MKLISQIPNTITSLNLLCGSCAVAATGFGRLDIAFLLMLCGGVFDFCDGLAARLLGAYSPMGKELDSLADQVTFGLLPALMLMWVTYGASGGTLTLLTFTPIFIAVFSGLRLAKFNVDERQASNFIGLPTPACAMICGSLAYFVYVAPDSPMGMFFRSQWLIPSLSIVLCALLVCGIPMFSMKIHKGDRLGWRRIAFLATVVILVTLAAIFKWNWSLSILFAFVAYILINITGVFADRFK